MAVTIDAYDQLIELMSDGYIDMDDATANTFKMGLLNNSHTFTATNTAWASISANEITGTGYTAGGQGLTSVTWAHTTGTVKWDSADVSWTAGAGGITAYHAVIYDDTTTGSPVDALMIDINFGQVETAGDGTDFIVSPDAANGWFTGSFTGA